MIRRYDARSPRKRITDAVEVWAYILGLSTLMLVWALTAWATIGSGTRVHPNYHLADTTPAAQPYNALGK